MNNPTPITCVVTVNKETEHERSIRVCATASRYAGKIYIRDINPMNSALEDLTEEEQIEAEPQIVDYVFSYIRVPDDGVDDLKGYPLGGGTD